MSAILGVVAVLSLGAACSSQQAAGDQPWKDGSVHGPWRAVFDGEGSTTSRAGVLTLSPRASASPQETHAGLVVSRAVHQDVDFRLRLRTVAQLRTAAPNPWETAWAVWGYSDPAHFYYVVLKTNGWEIGKADPDYPGSQRFLVTGARPFPIGSWYAVEVRQSGDSFTVEVDGVELARFTDVESPYRTGAVGVYAEDATAEFEAVEVSGR